MGDYFSCGIAALQGLLHQKSIFAVKLWGEPEASPPSPHTPHLPPYLKVWVVSAANEEAMGDYIANEVSR